MKNFRGVQNECFVGGFIRAKKIAITQEQTLSPTRGFL